MKLPRSPGMTLSVCRHPQLLAVSYICYTFSTYTSSAKKMLHPPLCSGPNLHILKDTDQMSPPQQSLSNSLRQSLLPIFLDLMWA